MDRALVLIENIRTVASRLVPMGLSSIAAGSIIAACIYAANAKIEIATTLIAIFIICTLTIALPRLRVIEGFGIKAQLAEEIRKAEVTLDQLKALARSSARYGFLQLRGGNLPLTAQRDLIVALNESMISAGLSETETAEIRRPLMDLIAADLLYVAQLASVHLQGNAIRAVDEELKKLDGHIVGAPDPNGERRERLRGDRARLMALEPTGGRQAATPDNLPSLLDRCDADFPRTEDEGRRLRNILASARRIMTDCLQSGGLTPDFVSFASFKPHHTPGFLAKNDLDERAQALLRSRFAEG